MARNARDAVLKYEIEVASGRLEELRLFVPKDVANKFRQVAKKLRMTPQALLEEMVEIYKSTSISTQLHNRNDSRISNT